MIGRCCRKSGSDYKRSRARNSKAVTRKGLDFRVVARKYAYDKTTWSTQTYTHSHT